MTTEQTHGSMTMTNASSLGAIHGMHYLIITKKRKFEERIKPFEQENNLIY